MDKYAGFGQMISSFVGLNREIIACEKCPRLRRHCQKVAREKRAAFRNLEYWGKPVPGFGDPNAELLLIGLAPGAHGSNRTGRMFTGDGSGQFLYAALHRAGFASQPETIDVNDGLELKNCFITAVGRCAPPENKPTRKELLNCRPFLMEELRLLKNLRAVLALGRIAFEHYLDLLKTEKSVSSKVRFDFKHGGVYNFPPPIPRLFASYHPSRQNTQTGRLTAKMMDKVFSQISCYFGGRRCVLSPAAIHLRRSEPFLAGAEISALGNYSQRQDVINHFHPERQQDKNYFSS